MQHGPFIAEKLLYTILLNYTEIIVHFTLMLQLLKVKLIILCTGG